MLRGILLHQGSSSPFPCCMAPRGFPLPRSAIHLSLKASLSVLRLLLFVLFPALGHPNGTHSHSMATIEASQRAQLTVCTTANKQCRREQEMDSPSLPWQLSQPETPISLNGPLTSGYLSAQLKNCWSHSNLAWPPLQRPSHLQRVNQARFVRCGEFPTIGL